MLYSVKVNYLHIYFIHTFNKYLWSVYHVEDTILGPKDIIINRKYKIFAFLELNSLKQWFPDFQHFGIS